MVVPNSPRQKIKLIIKATNSVGMIKGISIFRSRVKNEIPSNGEEIPVNISGGLIYVVPQKFRFENLPAMFDLFMRVGKVYEKASIILRNNDRDLKILKRKGLTPGEMIKTTLARDLFKGITGPLELILVSEDS